jgi:hypothetical protein
VTKEADFETGLKTLMSKYGAAFQGQAPELVKSVMDAASKSADPVAFLKMLVSGDQKTVQSVLDGLVKNMETATGNAAGDLTNAAEKAAEDAAAAAMSAAKIGGSAKSAWSTMLGFGRSGVGGVIAEAAKSGADSGTANAKAYKAAVTTQNPSKALTDNISTAPWWSIGYTGGYKTGSGFQSGLDAHTYSITVGAKGTGASVSHNLLQFAEGGMVPGRPGTPVPIIAHAGERVIPAREASRGTTTSTDAKLMAAVGDMTSEVRLLRQTWKQETARARRLAKSGAR